MTTNLPDGAALVDVGWGRLLFAHTFPTPESVAKVMLDEKQGKRDVAFYVNDPQLILNAAPQDLFLDPSSTYRLDLKNWKEELDSQRPFRITLLEKQTDVVEINKIYQQVGMVPVDEETVWSSRGDSRFSYFVAKPRDSDQVIGVALGIDHTRCFNDLFDSTSLWGLAVDPQSPFPSIGTALVLHLASYFADRGRSILDLSVIEGNDAAARLYEQLGFERVPVLLIKRRNQINEPLFVPKVVRQGYNSYASIIINEALRRGISVEAIDVERGYFRLSQGNRRVVCWESLSDLTSAIAICRCSDKQLTNRLLEGAGLSVPPQKVCPTHNEAEEFMQKVGSVVVKPLIGEQGQGVSVNVTTQGALISSWQQASRYHDKVLVEKFVEGKDLRIIVINGEVVAAVIRHPAEIRGTGSHTIEELIKKLSRRRSAATDGESNIPLDDETSRCLAEAGYSLDDVIKEGEVVQVRRTANLHTGGTLHDVTEVLSETLKEAAIRAALALEIPVVGLDFIVPDVSGDEYVIIEANERPGLANHEPQPTAERFIDLLFPHVPAAVG